MSLSEHQREGYESVPGSAGRVYEYGYGTALQVSENRRPDGTVEAVYDYAAILQADSSQAEGIGSFRALYVGQDPFPTARFRLLQCTVTTDEVGVKRNSYREVGQYVINLPKGQLDYLIKLVRNGDAIDLIASYPTGGEFSFHRVPVNEGGPVVLPSTVVLRPPAPPSPSFPSPERRQGEAKDLMARQQTVEALANELLIEARTRLGIRQVDSDGREYVSKQISALDERLEPMSMVNQPITVRHVNQLNQLRALIHDMQRTNPPLFDKTMTREWMAKLGV